MGEETYWSPHPELMNGGDADQNLGKEGMKMYTTAIGSPPVWVRGSPGSALSQHTATSVWVVAMMRMQSTVNALLILKRFPFDTQKLSFQIKSSDMQVSSVVFLPTSGARIGFIPSDGIDGWKILSSAASNENNYYAVFDESYSKLYLSLDVARLSDPLVQRYVWGVTFLVVMGILVLCISADEPDRLGFVQSSFLGIVSWQFILVSSTPNLGYSTRLDVFMIVAMGCVVEV